MTSVHTYTVVDVRKVFECLTADLVMLAYRTRALTVERARNLAFDLTLLAVDDYLKEVRFALVAKDGSVLAVRTCHPTEDAGLWDGAAPGANNWPCAPDGAFRTKVSYTPAWYAMTADERTAYTKDLKLNWVAIWSPEVFETEGLVSDGTRRYASRGYGLSRADYRPFA